MERSRRRVLFVAEDLTLAQIVRLAALAERLDRARYDVHFACREFPPLIFGNASATTRLWPLFTVDKEAALRRLARGERLYEAATLNRYVEDELELFDHVRPDLVVGDFRLSLQVSAPYARIPRATLINAYWSPHAVRDAFPVPDHPIVSLIGPERAARYLPQALPRAFAHFAAPLDKVRRRFGLPPMEDLLLQLTDGDLTLYPDVPELCPVAGAPLHHVYLGAVPWSPPVPLPEFWSELRDDAPVVYVTLGSSGRLAALSAVLEGLADLPVQVVLSSAGRSAPRPLPRNVHVAEYLPGQLVARRSRFVVTNGGSSTGYQALAEGVPVLGVPFNLDQYLAMSAIERASAGVSVRAGSARPADVRRAALHLLDSPAFAAAARDLSRAFHRYDCFAEFSSVLAEFFGDSTSDVVRPTLYS